MFNVIHTKVNIKCCTTKKGEMTVQHFLTMRRKLFR